jgi:hypothetical protein
MKCKTEIGIQMHLRKCRKTLNTSAVLEAEVKYIGIHAVSCSVISWFIINANSVLHPFCFN